LLREFLFGLLKRKSAVIDVIGESCRGLPIRVLAATLFFLLPSLLLGSSSWSSELPDTVARIKPSIVAVGTYQRTRRPPNLIKATGFVVGNGHMVATNAHVIPGRSSIEHGEQLAVFVKEGDAIRRSGARVLAVDKLHDTALLAIDGPALPPLTLATDRIAREGETIAFTGFPIGSVLGLYPVTHTGIISALTPIASPALKSKQLDVRLLRSLKKGGWVLQLDATAYPGNSGSPVYVPTTGTVIGILSSTFVKETKEKILSDPSGISYAIPIRHLNVLLSTLKSK
jgi:S1-C subfamily serine protease